MLESHPYKLWPLHVKLFTEQAAKAWNEAETKLEELLPGSTVVTELEGVDGKSGKTGSGRQGPIDVTDAAFIARYIPKHSKIAESKKALNCSVCLGPIDNYSPESLFIALCPTQDCTAVSHLTCLSTHFLTQYPSESRILPRGGECKSCHSYVLWGDIIRGCYRRHKGTVVVETDEDEDDELTDAAAHDSEPDIPVKPSKRPRAPTKSKKSKKPTTSVAAKSKDNLKPPPAIGVKDDSTEEECFDLDCIKSDESMDVEMNKKQPKLLDNLSRLSISSPSRPASDIDPDIIILSD